MRIACFSRYYSTLEKVVKKLSKEKNEKDELNCIAFRYLFDDSAIENLRKYDVNKVVMISNILLMQYDLEAFTNALAEYYKKYGFDLLILGNSLEDKEVAARLSSKLGISAVTNCLSYKIENEKIIVERFHSSGLLIAKIELSTPSILSLYRVEDQDSKLKETPADLEILKIPLSVSRVVIRDKLKLSERYQEIQNSKILICIGENVHEEKELKEIYETAKIIGATVVGDKSCYAREWFKEWIAFSGIQASAKICLSIGTKGDIDYLGALTGTDTVIFLNEEPDTLALKFSDYHAICDIHKLIHVLKKRAKKKFK